MPTEYNEFLHGKAIRAIPTGIDPGDPPSMLFEFQRDIVKWALRRGRSAIFADCGLGKTPMQLSWADQVPGKVLILAPLAVSQQTVREGAKFGIDLEYSRHPIDSRITITNYEMLDHFNPKDYTGIVLDESSILKSYDGKFRNQIVESFKDTPFKLACTATPAPNDHMELGNHAEFLGVLSRTEMLSTFFVHDGGDTSKWRLKGHAERDFWRWMCSWAVMIRKPSDLGYEDGKFTLPAMTMHQTIVEALSTPEGALFALEATTLQERQQARKSTTQERCKAVASIVMEYMCKISVNTSNHGIQKTKIELNKQDLQTKKYATSEQETDTQTIQNTETESNQSIGAIGFSGHTESRPKNSMQFYSLREEGVQFAENPQDQRNSKSCALTTATNQGQSVESYAHLAMSLSENSGMTQNCLGEQWLIWTNLNCEADTVEKMIPGSVQVSGSDTLEFKERAVLDFISGKTRILVSKPSIFGFGLNLQNCRNVVFLGLSDSYEQFYQAVRRCYRFGQTREVNCWIVTSDIEGAVVANIERKEQDAARMADEMVSHMHDINSQEIRGTVRTDDGYNATVKMELPTWLEAK